MSKASNIETCAADWLLRTEEAGWSETDQAQLNSWLSESDAHKAAYWRLEAGWRSADRLAALRSDHDTAIPQSRQRLSWAWPIAASVIVIFGIGSFSWWNSVPALQQVEKMHVATNIGKRKLVQLEDGSKIDLNTNSSIRTATSEEKRVVWLDSGEAYFDIAKRSGQKFIVYAGTKTITVLGTKFSVRRDGEKVSVVVEEGRVRVDDTTVSGSARSAVIEGGDVAVSRGLSTLITTASPEKIDDALAWREGMLNFDQRSLAEVAQEFNRYNQKKLVIGDADAAAIQIGGSFKASNVDAFVRLLRDAYRLNVDDSGASVTISS